MKAVVIGPGRIGCGFVGQLLRQDGHEVSFIGRGAVVGLLQAAGCYTVQLIEGRRQRTTTVTDVSAIDATDWSRAVEALAAADLIATAVGAPNLVAIAALIAAGLCARARPARVIAFENAGNAGPHLQRLVAGHLLSPDLLSDHGFSGAVVSRVVSQRHIDLVSGELRFVGDPYDEFHVDGRSLGAAEPFMAGMVLTDDYPAAVQRKLYTYSLGHAAVAYLGFLKGYHYVHTAIRDPEIRQAVLAAMTEGQAAVTARHGRAQAGDHDDLLAILRRFENAALNDTIQRVGRDPLRKLAVNDRLVGAVRLAVASGATPIQLPVVVAAALCFVDPLDPSATELRRAIEAAGVEPVLRSVCELDPAEDLGRAVVDWWRRLGTGWAEDNPLLSLNGVSWEGPWNGATTPR